MSFSKSDPTCLCVLISFYIELRFSIESKMYVEQNVPRRSWLLRSMFFIGCIFLLYKLVNHKPSNDKMQNVAQYLNSTDKENISIAELNISKAREVITTKLDTKIPSSLYIAQVSKCFGMIFFLE